jgi:hypothetical protein
MLSILVFIFSCCLCIYTAQNIKNPNNKIVDFIHTTIPYIDSLEYWSDILIFIQIFFCIYISSINDIVEMFLIMSITQVYRTICNVSTTLPQLKKYSDKIRLGGINGSGSEYIFSGHASYSAITFIYLIRYGYNIYLLSIYNLFSQSLITITRNHYTVDIVLAWIIVPLLWCCLFLCKKDIKCENNINFLLY